MPVQLPLYADVPSQTYTIDLDGEQYGIRLHWSDLRAGWYIGIESADGTPLLRGRRLVPYASATRGVVRGGPPGLLTAIGPYPYRRDELVLVYVPRAELSLIPPGAPDDGRLVLLT